RDLFARAASPRTAITLLYNFQQRPDFTRTLAKMSYGYEWSRRRKLTFGLYPLEVNVIRIPRRSAEFQSYLEQANDPVLTDSYTDHLIAGMRALMTINTQETSRTPNVFYSRTSVEWAGNPVFIPMRAFGVETLDTAGNKFFTVAGVRYAEFVKVDQEFRWRRMIHDRSSMAFRLSGGIGVPYGNLGVLPFESSFFVGGANGLRAWRARSVGPGSYSSPVHAFDRIGEIRMEGNAEYRFHLIGFLEGALFADVGNIWNLEQDVRKPGSAISGEFLSELAVGTGFGARLNFDFFIVRLDLGLQTKDPSLPKGERWLFEPKTEYIEGLIEQEADVLEYRPQVNFNLGIGYPF
nr:outer membrane protein assembly factor [Bacteroidota bacterium]